VAVQELDLVRNDGAEQGLDIRVEVATFVDADG
jgi:hypothetical protein